MKEKKSRLPGYFTNIVSFIPVFNWIALIILGKKCTHKISIVFGIVWGILTFALPDIAAYIWIIVMIQYAVTRRKIKKKYTVGNGLMEENKRDKLRNQPADSKMFFSDVLIEGDEEAKQLIPKRPFYPDIKESNINTSYYANTSVNKFITDMKTFGYYSQPF